MAYSNLIIKAKLSQRPSDALCFRFITLCSKERIGLTNIIQTEKEAVDIYYKWMRLAGLMDFVAAIITENEVEEGIRLDTEPNYPVSVIVERVDWPQLNLILGQIKYLSGFK